VGKVLLARGPAGAVIRVLEILATLKRAGAERMAVSLACGLDRGRFEPAVISLYDALPGGFEAALAECGVPVQHLGKRRGFDPRMYPRLWRAIGKFRPTIIHTHSYVLRYVWPAAAAMRSARVVHTVHNSAEREVDVAGRILHRVAFRCGVAPVAVADEVARSFRALYGREPAAVIPNGVEIERMRRADMRERWRREQGFAPDALLLVSVARLDPQKNPLLLVEAFARAASPNCHLLLAGDGSLRDRVKQLAARLGVAAQVHLLGVRQDIPELLSACDVFVLASTWEGNPMSVMEAMAAGLPIVATAAGGVPDVVANAGLLAEPGNAGELAGALAAVVNDPERRRRLAEAARRRAPRFSAGTMIACYADLFERLAS
jgi:glycosyltransferase involved in cell wall biosynthesis